MEANNSCCQISSGAFKKKARERHFLAKLPDLPPEVHAACCIAVKEMEIVPSHLIKLGTNLTVFRKDLVLDILNIIV